MNKGSVDINLEGWDYKCGDGCCTDYGTTISVNGEKCDNEYAGDDVEKALEFTLKKLGYNVNFTFSETI